MRAAAPAATATAATATAAASAMAAATAFLQPARCSSSGRKEGRGAKKKTHMKFHWDKEAAAQQRTMLPLPLSLLLSLSPSLPQPQHQLQAPPGCGLHFKLAHLVESVGNSSPSQPVRQSWPPLPAATATATATAKCGPNNCQLPLATYHLFFYQTFFSSVPSVKCLYSLSLSNSPTVTG